MLLVACRRQCVNIPDCCEQPSLGGGSTGWIVALFLATGAALGVGGGRFNVTDAGRFVIANTVGTAVFISPCRVAFMNCDSSK